MIGRVLVALDGSEDAEAILPFLERLADPVDVEVILLRVVEPPSPGEAHAAAGAVAPYTPLLRQLEAKEYLAEVAKRLGAKGLRVRTRLGLGAPAREIVDFAKADQADLIAMTTHGRGGLRRVLFGSVAEEVLRQAEIPVLLFRMTAPAPVPKPMTREP